MSTTLVNMEMNMKRFLPIICAFSACIFGVSCQKEVQPEIVDDGLVTVTLSAGKPEMDPATKTEMSGSSVLWSANDAIGVVKGAKQYKFNNDNTTGSSVTTTFTGQTSVDSTLYAYYPYSSLGIALDGAKVDIKNIQNPKSNDTFDGSSDVLVSKPFAVDAATKNISNLEFRRLTAVVKIVLNDSDSSLSSESLKFVTIKTPGTNLTGRAYVNFSTSSFGELYTSQCDSVRVNSAADFSIDGSKALYASVYPTTILSGSTLVVSGSTSNHSFSREFTLTNDIKFESGKITTIKAKIRQSDCNTIVKTDYSGDYMIVSSKVDTLYAMSTYYSGSDFITASTYTINAENKAVGDNLDLCKYTISKETSGTYADMYTIKDKNGKYLFASSATKNYIGASTSLTADSYWDITFTDGEYSVVATKSTNRNVLQFNYNNGSPRFTCYSSASMTAVSLLPWSDVYVPEVVIPSYSSVAALAAADDITAGTTVSVSLSDEPIKSIYANSSGTRTGVYFDAQKDGNDVEIYLANVPEEWVVGGVLTGTVTGEWKSFNGTWEIVPASGWAWTNLTYAVPSIPKQVATLTLGTYKTTLNLGDNSTDTYSVTYTGDGTVSASSSDISIATVAIEDNTVTVKAKKSGVVTVTISASATESLFSVCKHYTLSVQEYKQEVITLSSGIYSGSGTTGQIVWTGTSVTITQTKNNSTTNVNSSYVANPRWYGSHIISFEANSNYTVKGAIITCSSSDYATALQSSSYSNGASATANGSTVTITSNGNFTITLSGQSRISSVKVLYDE